MSAQQPTRRTVTLALDMVGDDERRARIAWSRLLEPGRERPRHDSSALAAAIEQDGHVLAWQRLCAGDLDRAESARARVAEVDVDAEVDRVRRIGARTLIPGDEEWPSALDHPSVAPHLIHVRGAGRLDLLARRSVAVVGSRASSGYGEAVAREIGNGLTRAGWSVVSGAAFGIDAAAHHGGLTGEQGCIAVLPCGPDRIYPASHARLIDAVSREGVVITELATGMTAQRHRFLSRNRIIAGLSRAVVVVEAGLRSGSLNTAGWAESMHIPVAAVPGPVTSMASAGCNEWIAAGRAQLVVDAGDVIRLAGHIGEIDGEEVERLGPARSADVLTQHQRRVHDLLRVRKETTVGELASALLMPVEEILAQLGVLSVQGWAVQGEFGGWLRGEGR